MCAIPRLRSQFAPAVVIALLNQVNGSLLYPPQLPKTDELLRGFRPERDAANGAAKVLYSVRDAVDSGGSVFATEALGPRRVLGQRFWRLTAIHRRCGSALSNSNGWNWHPHAQVGSQLAAILDKMLMPTPSQRFHSAQDVIDALAGATPATRRPQPSPIPSSASTTTPMGMPPIQPATPAPIAPSLSQSVSAQQPTPASSQANSGFSLLEFLAGAAFTGFEGALLAIALFSLSFLGTLVSSIFWLC